MDPDDLYAPPKVEDKRALPLVVRLTFGLLLVLLGGLAAISVRDLLKITELAGPTRFLVGTLSGAICGVWGFQLLLPPRGRGRNFFVLVLGVGLPLLFMAYGPSATRTGPPIGIVAPTLPPEKK